MSGSLPAWLRNGGMPLLRIVDMSWQASQSLPLLMLICTTPTGLLFELGLAARRLLGTERDHLNHAQLNSFEYYAA